jgi:hypothetical protein
MVCLSFSAFALSGWTPCRTGLSNWPHLLRNLRDAWFPLQTNELGGWNDLYPASARAFGPLVRR